MRVEQAVKIEDRLKIYQGFAELGRKWSSVMDAKASFLSVLNVALLSFIWTQAKLSATSGWIYKFSILATAVSIVSLIIALKVILPRTTLKQIFGQPLSYTNGNQAVSFFGFVASNYPIEKHTDFIEYVNGMDEEDFLKEAIEQHYTISHVVQKKSSHVATAGNFWFLACCLTLIAMLIS